MNHVRVIDFETTGVPEDAVKAICEIGFTDVFSDWTVSQTTSFLVNPGHKIPVVTRAIHHISDEDVAGAISPDVGLRTLMEGMGEGDVFAAHNAKFEQAFFSGGNHRWICTMQTAKHLFPDAPSFSNQALRYWLDVDPEFDDAEKAMPPHRAGPDTYVTAFILRRLIAASSVADLVRLTDEPVILRDVKFGKHRGQKWADLPFDYLNWVANKSDLGPDEKHTARHILRSK